MGVLSTFRTKMAVFCTSTLESLPSMSCRCFWNGREDLNVAPVTIGMAFVLPSHILYLSHNYLHTVESILRNGWYSEVVKKFTTFYEARRFVTLVTRAHHRLLSRARWIQPLYPNFYKFHFNNIFPFTPSSSEWSLHAFHPKYCTHVP
jgi:hypothetical protein